MRDLFTQVGNNLIAKIFKGPFLEQDPELDHLRRMRRLRKFMGNISSHESKIVEEKIESLSLEFNYPREQVVKALEWLIESYGSDPLFYKEHLRKVLKLSKTLGRSTCTSLKREDLFGIIPPLLH
jgi:hypothetical protein